MKDPTPIGRVPSGISGLDTILNGGFLTGGIYIIQGTPGTGKTTLANQICFSQAASGGKALYITLLAEYHDRMLQHLSNMSFFDITIFPSGSNISTAMARWLSRTTPDCAT
jgi:circadian clock protein KaiC